MMHADAARDESVGWLPAERLGQWRVDARLRPWLIGQGLLSERLRARCGGRFELRQAHMWTGLLPPGERRLLAAGDSAALYREDELRCDGRLCAVTLAIMPDSTLAAHPWLAELGDSSLAETLTGLSGVERSAYEYAWLRAATPLAARALQGDASCEGLWSRRSRLALRAAPLIVQELFLPALAEA
jgi:chorismate-pyruvate lyase